MPELGQGKLPKSVESIRASLESIHKKAEVDFEPGPHVDGLERDYPIAVATYFDRTIAAKVQQLLSQQGVFSKVVNVQHRASVVVDNEDHLQATKILRQHQVEFPNVFPKKESRRFDFLIFGIAIGLTIGVMICVDVYDDPRAASIPITFTAIGGVFGHLLDRMRMGLIRTGRFRIGIWEILIATSIPGMIYLAAQFIAAIFKG